MTPCRGHRVIGLTGGIATGKSTVSSILKEKDLVVIDADEIARRIMRPGKEAYKDIVDYYGREILRKNGTIDRKKLGNIVFNNSDLLEKLNEITHPRIFREIYKDLKKYIKSGEKLIFIDIPLLFEEYDKILEYKIDFDEIWLVYLDRKTQISRLMKRDNISREDAINKIDLQLDIEYKLEKSDRIIYNNKDINYLKENIEKLLNLEW